MQVNEDKNLCIQAGGATYERYPIKTHVITDADDIRDVAEKYAKDMMQTGDVLFISEKAVACTQRRAIPMDEIKPSFLARLLCKFVYRSPYGIGLSIPETMEMALRECGRVRVLFAAFCSAFGKLFGKRGVFYNIVGDKARSIDGPCDCTIPPYNRCVVLGPAEPDKVAMSIKERIGFDTIIVDINDMGGNILGASDMAMDRQLYADILKDNPLGQSRQQTPMGIIRKA